MLSKAPLNLRAGFNRSYSAKTTPDLHMLLLSIGGISFFERLNESLKYALVPQEVGKNIKDILAELKLHELTTNALQTPILNNNALPLCKIVQNLNIVFECLEYQVERSAAIEMIYQKDLKNLSHVMKLLGEHKPDVNKGHEL